MKQTEETQVIRDASAESILAELTLEEHLKEAGDVCSYAALRDKLGSDPRLRPTYGYVKTARNRFERKHGCVLEAHPNEGIKWLKPASVVVTRNDHDTGHIRRFTKASLRRQKTAIKADLPPEIQKRLNENLTHLGTLAHFSKAETRRRINEAVEKSGHLLNAGDVLQHFQKG